MNISKHVRLWKMVGLMTMMLLLTLSCATTTSDTEPEVLEPSTVSEEQEDPSNQLSTTEQEPIATYQVGDQGPAGGYIFYVDSANQFEWTYLEAAPAGWYGQPEDPAIAWGDPEILTGAEGREIGEGQNNTRLIFEHDSEITAASIIAGITIGDFSDWFLPSQNELNQMYNQLHRRGLGDFARQAYWSSTESMSQSAFTQNFSHSGQIASTKTNERRVRPIRAF
jgi:hypothetical protein